MTENLWAPWRMAYVGREDPEGGCFLCRAGQAAADADREHLVVARGERWFCIINRFPYNNGHVMIAPYEHQGDLGGLDEACLTDMMRAVVVARDALRRALGAQGFNIGLNLGRCAGAGVADHLHVHVVPRWPGDVNFMPVLADVKVIPQALEDLCAALVRAKSSDETQKG